MINIKTIRESIGITREELSKLSGIDLGWIVKMEDGEIKLENITASSMVFLLKGLSSAANGTIYEERILEDYQYLKSAYIVTKILLSNE